MSPARSERVFARPFSIRIERPASGVVSVAVVGELDRACAPIVSETFRVALEDPDQPILVLDLTELDFIDSWGVSTASSAARALRKRDGSQLIVAGGGLQVKRVFSLIHISRVVHLVDSLEDALIVAEGHRASGSQPAKASQR